MREESPRTVNGQKQAKWNVRLVYPSTVGQSSSSTRWNRLKLYRANFLRGSGLSMLVARILRKLSSRYISSLAGVWTARDWSSRLLLSPSPRKVYLRLPKRRIWGMAKRTMDRNVTRVYSHNNRNRRKHPESHLIKKNYQNIIMAISQKSNYHYPQMKKSKKNKNSHRRPLSTWWNKCKPKQRLIRVPRKWYHRISFHWTRRYWRKLYMR